MARNFEKNSCSQMARLEVLFPFQIYLFSQVQGDLEHQRTETLILVQYLHLIYMHVKDIIEKATRCFCEQVQSLDSIMQCLRCSILQQLIPFIMTCLYCGSLDDDIMIAADNQISDMVRLWTNFLNIVHLNVDTVEDDDNCVQVALFSKRYGSTPSTATAWYLSLLYILVAADSRYITGLAPAVVPLTSQDELLMVWARSYILSGGLAEWELKRGVTRRDKSAIVDHEFLYPLYCEKDPMWKVVYSWMEVSVVAERDAQCHFRESMWKNKLYRNAQLEFRVFIVLIHLSRLEKMLQTYYAKLQSALARAA